MSKLIDMTKDAVICICLAILVPVTLGYIIAFLYMVIF